MKISRYKKITNCLVNKKHDKMSKTKGKWKISLTSLRDIMKSNQ